MEKTTNLKEAMKELLLLIPNLLMLLYGLVKDSRVPVGEKNFLFFIIAYVLLPFDLIPDPIPFMGQIDDLFLVAVALKRIFDSVPQEVMQEYWNGEKDLIKTVEEVINLAVYFIPEKIRKVLLNQI
ncbi:DUF1232 domain-containing protein [bacterium]|nr:DUF1232 domain-containing protein [bacterium]